MSPEPPELAGFHVDSLTRATTGKVEYHSDQPESPLGPGTQWAAPSPCHWQASFSKFFLLGQKAAMLLVRPLGRELQVEFAHRGLSLGGPQRDSRSVPVLGDPEVVALSE